MGFNITPKSETTLEEMLSFNLDRYLEELQEVASRASKEFSLEKVRKKCFLCSVVETSETNKYDLVF